VSYPPADKITKGDFCGEHPSVEANLPISAQSASSDPWDNAVSALKTAFIGTIATGQSLVAIVVDGMMFVPGRRPVHKTLAGIIFGLSVAIG
jgi:type IV secretory pathway VirB2 component (pilin)